MDQLLFKIPRICGIKSKRDILLTFSRLLSWGYVLHKLVPWQSANVVVSRSTSMMKLLILPMLTTERYKIKKRL